MSSENCLLVESSSPAHPSHLLLSFVLLAFFLVASPHSQTLNTRFFLTCFLSFWHWKPHCNRVSCVYCTCVPGTKKSLCTWQPHDSCMCWGRKYTCDPPLWAPGKPLQNQREMNKVQYSLSKYPIQQTKLPLSPQMNPSYSPTTLASYVHIHTHMWAHTLWTYLMLFSIPRMSFYPANASNSSSYFPFSSQMLPFLESQLKLPQAGSGLPEPDTSIWPCTHSNP